MDVISKNPVDQVTTETIRKNMHVYFKLLWGYPLTSHDPSSPTLQNLISLNEGVREITKILDRH